MDGFYNSSLEPSNLFPTLCAAGVRAFSFLRKLHSLCFDEERERTEFLYDFYEKGFTSVDLYHILNGAVHRLEKFHDFCFIGDKKKYLYNFVNEK